MPLSTKSLNAEVAAANVDMSLGAEPGKKKAAGTALKRLAELLATGEGARAHAAMICENRLREGSAAQAPTWDGVLSRVIFLLSVPNKLAKNDVEKLRSLVGAAVGAGPGAMSSKAELKVFCYVCEELCDAAKTPPRADRTSAHPECIGVLLHLTSNRHQLLARLSPQRQRELLCKCIGWITGERAEGGDDANSPDRAATGGGRSSAVDAFDDDVVSAPAGGGSTAPRGPHATVAALPQLMLQYAQLLHRLVTSWLSDLPVCDRSAPDEDGPLASLLGLLTDVCEAPPPHLSKMANLLWSAAVHAIVHHGCGALHEVRCAFGSEPPSPHASHHGAPASPRVPWTPPPASGCEWRATAPP